MRADPRGVYQTRPCPKCGAQPGVPCRNTKGRGTFTGLVHYERTKEQADDV